MCRIAGIVNFPASIADCCNLVLNMCQLLKHGGPDDEGLFQSTDDRLVFGHRRLSLIDISSAGHQPMTYQNRFTITYNGEIYNYRELKAELISLGYEFHTATDTEVILAAFSEWHIQSFNKLNGMYAFAIHDDLKKEVFLVRDPVGIKPLYYSYDGQSLIFASEARAFKAVNAAWPEQPYWPAYMMAYGHIPEPHTLYKNVLSLPKGSFIKYDLHESTLMVQSFRHFSFSSQELDRGQLINLVTEKVEHAIVTHLVSDAPVGVFLSGGIDSSIITKVADRKLNGRLNTMSIYYNETDYSEKYYQDILLKDMQGVSRQYLLSQTEFNGSFPLVLDAMDMPSCDGINTWFISKYAKEAGLKAVLSGIGADELFGGYPSFERMQAARLLASMPEALLGLGRKSGLKQLKRTAYLRMKGIKGIYLFLRGYFSVYEIALQLDAGENEIWEALNGMVGDNDVSSLDFKNQASWMEFHMYLQNQLLRDADVMGMAHGVEIRVPFLSNDLVDLMMSSASNTKFYPGRPKQLLIDAFINDLPEPIWKRKKMGFTFPFDKWLLNNSFVEDSMRSGNERTRIQYQKFLNGKLHWSHLMNLLLLRQSAHA